MSNLILYTTDDGKSQVQLRAKSETVWLSQREMAELLDVRTDNVGLHLKNVLAQGELESHSVTVESSVTASDGTKYQTHVYNLDAILTNAARPLKHSLLMRRMRWN